MTILSFQFQLQLRKAGRKGQKEGRNQGHDTTLKITQKFDKEFLPFVNLLLADQKRPSGTSD